MGCTRLYRNQDREAIFPSEFAHVTLMLATLAKKPLLVIRQRQVRERGALRRGYVHPIVEMPNSAGAVWLKTKDFENAFVRWLTHVRKQKHVFLGYASQARETANEITRYLTGKLGLTILDWHDFRPSEIVIDAIEKAELLTVCGIFLFMVDDILDVGSSAHGAPRDNVVYEAGYFAGAKGRERTVIIREQGAKVPSDLAGVLYLELTNRRDISHIETRLKDYFSGLFE